MVQTFPNAGEMRIVMRIYVLLMVLSFVASPVKAEINSSLILAVDYSGSYVDRRKDGEMKQLFGTVNKFLARAAAELPANVSFKALSITELSSIEKPDCEAEGYAKGLFGKKTGGGRGQYLVSPPKKSSEPSEFEQYLTEICIHRLVKRTEKGAGGTDISGAIDSVVTIAREEAEGPKVLVVMSDFYEYKDAALPNFKFDLSGFRILMVYRTAYDVDANNQAKLTREKALEWKRRFESSGADAVFLMDERSSKAVGQAIRKLL